ncbi:hypothetical protein MRB53_019082 [Persea americana]|uniref:Uncharacterized protein n=1 Tax=Persea americana TaxID=3435 RepID=A0ACC2MAE3_PERAE|nr:hypothetical protein MRB53_019082 [Persea americana]
MNEGSGSLLYQRRYRLGEFASLPVKRVRFEAVMAVKMSRGESGSQKLRSANKSKQTVQDIDSSVRRNGRENG